jgi:hypothetical protein
MAAEELGAADTDALGVGGDVPAEGTAEALSTGSALTGNGGGGGGSGSASADTASDAIGTAKVDAEDGGSADGALAETLDGTLAEARRLDAARGALTGGLGAASAEAEPAGAWARATATPKRPPKAAIHRHESRNRCPQTRADSGECTGDLTLVSRASVTQNGTASSFEFAQQFRP